MALVIQKKASNNKPGGREVVHGGWLASGFVNILLVKFLILDSVSPIGYEKVFCTLEPRTLDPRTV